MSDFGHTEFKVIVGKLVGVRSQTYECQTGALPGSIVCNGLSWMPFSSKTLEESAGECKVWNQNILTEEGEGRVLAKAYPGPQAK